jgi:hypothetical protein
VSTGPTRIGRWSELDCTSALTEAAGVVLAWRPLTAWWRWPKGVQSRSTVSDTSRSVQSELSSGYLWPASSASGDEGSNVRTAVSIPRPQGRRGIGGDLRLCGASPMMVACPHRFRLGSKPTPPVSVCRTGVSVLTLGRDVGPRPPPSHMGVELDQRAAGIFPPRSLRPTLGPTRQYGTGRGAGTCQRSETRSRVVY